MNYLINEKEIRKICKASLRKGKIPDKKEIEEMFDDSAHLEPPLNRAFDYDWLLQILDSYWLEEEDESIVNIEMYFEKANGENNGKIIEWRNPDYNEPVREFVCKSALELVEEAKKVKAENIKAFHEGEEEERKIVLKRVKHMLTETKYKDKEDWTSAELLKWLTAVINGMG